MNFLVFVLALLFIKHWYIDFVNQSSEEIQWKGTYLDWRGVKHSLKHGLGTFLVMALVDYDLAFLLGSLDFILHYHIDWAKININKKHGYTTQDKEFWAWLGADQLAHSLTYLLIVWIWVNQLFVGS